MAKIPVQTVDAYCLKTIPLRSSIVIAKSQLGEKLTVNHVEEEEEEDMIPLVHRKRKLGVGTFGTSEAGKTSIPVRDDDGNSSSDIKIYYRSLQIIYPTIILLDDDAGKDVCQG